MDLRPQRDHVRLDRSVVRALSYKYRKAPEARAMSVSSSYDLREDCDIKRATMIYNIYYSVLKFKLSLFLLSFFF